MKSSLTAALALSSLVFALILSSCSLSHLKGTGASGIKSAKGTPLQPGVRYEVRKALASNVPFRPGVLKRYHFVMETPRPPMLAAAGARARRMSVRTTAYCHDESDHLVYGKRNAVGTMLKFGTVRSAAADWSRFPVGTRFRITGQPNVIYEVDDYGSALVGTGTIDLYKPTRGQMDDWGVRHVDIEVLHWGSFQRSMELMEDRQRWPHVRQMMESIQEKVIEATGRRPSNTTTAMTLPASGEAAEL